MPDRDVQHLLTRRCRLMQAQPGHRVLQRHHGLDRARPRSRADPPGRQHRAGLLAEDQVHTVRLEVPIPYIRPVLEALTANLITDGRALSLARATRSVPPCADLTALPPAIFFPFWSIS